MTERRTRKTAPRNSRDSAKQPGSNDISTMVSRAVDQFATMTAKQVDGVTGIRREDKGGWSLLIDVMELERVPSTTSVIATYRVDVDENSELTGYERLRRYVRGTVDPT